MQEFGDPQCASAFARGNYSLGTCIPTDDGADVYSCSINPKDGPRVTISAYTLNGGCAAKTFIGNVSYAADNTCVYSGALWFRWLCQ
jgi:hypothetical protein